MRTLSFFELGQRLILVTMPAWLAWSLLTWLSAPHRPGSFLFIVFVCSLVCVYLGCVWAVSAILSGNSIWKLCISMALGALPFIVIVVLGHYISKLIFSYLS